ncbi:MAG: kelch repeat-containing protein [Planctomycetota bacterium]
MAVPRLMAQVDWQRASTFSVVGPACFDSHRNVVYLQPSIGSTSTYAWDGNQWFVPALTSLPPLGSNRSMAFDAVRRQTVLCGPTGNVMATWTFDGVQWVARQPALSPPVLTGTSMAFDPLRGRVVLFGGNRFVMTQAGPRNISQADTWEWDGTTWASVPIPGPSARSTSAMFFDSSLGKVVLFGGALSTTSSPLTTPLGETWSYDGVAWTRHPGAEPAPRGSAACAYDPVQQVGVLFGGSSGFGTVLGDTWLWNGSWSQSSGGPQPLPREGAAMSQDPTTGLLLHGGLTPTGYLFESWRFFGGSWTLVSEAKKPTQVVAGTYDGSSNRFFVLGPSSGGSGSSHWERTARGWQERPVAPAPAWNGSLGRMAYDSGRLRSVLLLSNVTGTSTSTWEFDGLAWTQHASAQSPSPRHRYGIAYDSARHQVVVFGGSPLGAGGIPPLRDTWTWDGARWTLAATSGPIARVAPGMTDDVSRGRVVLFGGNDLSTIFLGQLNDTWEWNGVSWTQRTPAVAPPASAGSALVYDRARRCSVLWGGYGPTANSSVSWEWDGVSWTPRPTNARPNGNREIEISGYDEVTGRVTVYTDDDASTTLYSLWDYGPVSPASTLRFGRGCTGPVQLELSARTGYGGWIGEDLILEAGSIAQPSIAMWWFGDSRSAWGSIPLPHDLSAMGLSGCSLLAEPLNGWITGVSSSLATTSIRVPASPGLIGAEVHAQAAVPDAAANPLGHVLSNGLTVRIGSR